MKAFGLCVAVVLSVLTWGCGNDADDARIGAECTATGQCENEELICLAQFKGGYCGSINCLADTGCPDGSICVTQGGANYCFRTCEDKAECNKFRSAENESNCSSNITRVGGGSQKACVPPSGT
jgi:hypothetical protein